MPFTIHVTLWFVFPVTLAENCVVLPTRSVALEGVTVTPFEVAPELDPLKPPPQAVQGSMAKERINAPANLAAEDLSGPIISDPLPRRSEHEKTLICFGAS